MSAYLINHLGLPCGVPNAEELDYLEQVEATAKPYGATWLALADVNVVEGAWPGSVVLVEFPSFADAQDWFASPECQRLLPLRINNAISDLILVEGVCSDFSVANLARRFRGTAAAASGTDR